MMFLRFYNFFFYARDTTTARCFFWRWTGNLGFKWWIKIKNSGKESVREKKFLPEPFFSNLWSLIGGPYWDILTLNHGNQRIPCKILSILIKKNGKISFLTFQNCKWKFSNHRKMKIFNRRAVFQKKGSGKIFFSRADFFPLFFILIHHRNPKFPVHPQKKHRAPLIIANVRLSNSRKCILSIYKLFRAGYADKFVQIFIEQ
jgi:hypothetical protein